MEFQGSFRIGQRENLRYNLLVARGRILLFAVVVFLIILVLTGAVRYGESGDISAVLSATLPFAFGGAVLLAAANFAMLYLKVRALYRQKPAPLEQTLRLDGSGLNAHSQTGAAEHSWRELTGVKESRRDFYLFLSGGAVYMLPKEQLQDPADAARLRELLRACAPHCRLRLRS